MDPLRHVKFYATIKHAAHNYSGLPYTHHLAAVEAVLRRFGITDEDMLQASWLHDSVEDCDDVKVKDIAEMFSDRVAELVSAVTNEPGENRKIRTALTYPKIRSVPGATILKLADRIANVEMGGKLLDMYRKEYENFRINLYDATNETAAPMWQHLDKLMA